MGNALGWGTLGFLILSALLQATWLFGGRGKRDAADVLDSAMDELKDEMTALRQRVHDLVDFWETQFVRKDVAEAKWGDLQGQINRTTDELKQLRKDLDRRGQIH